MKIFNQFQNQFNKKTEHFFIRTKERNKNKIERLRNRQKNKQIQINKTEKWVENLTNQNIPNEVLKILSLGPNYTTTMNNEKTIPTSNILCSIESGISHLQNTQKDEIRAKCTNIITNFKNKFKNSGNHKN